MFRVIVFDDREPDGCIYVQKCKSEEDGIREGRHYIKMMFQDPDDGYIPSHLDVRVEVARFITEVYDDAFPQDIHSSFESEKELQVIFEAKQALEVLRHGPVIPVGRYTFRLRKEWREC